MRNRVTAPSPSPAHPLTLAFALTLAPTCLHPRTHSPLPSHPLALTPSPSPAHPFALTLTLTRTPTCRLPPSCLHTHSHPLTLALAFTCAPSCPRPMGKPVPPPIPTGVYLHGVWVRVAARIPGGMPMQLPILSGLLCSLNIDPWCVLHNAGNDVLLMLVAFQRMVHAVP